MKRFLREHHLRLIATDKNLGLALISNDNYRELALKHLKDTRNYKKVNITKDDIYAEHYNRLVALTREVSKEFNHIANLDHFLNQALLRNQVQIPKFHILAKVHKANLSGRPIAGAVNWITTRISAFLSYALRPIVEEKPHILKDSSEFVRNIESQAIPSDAILVSLDVEALYPSMRRQYLKQALKQLDTPVYSALTIELLTNLAEFILDATYVQFGDSIFQQIEGMSMGTNAAVELANLYVDYLIEQSEVFINYRQLFKLYFRYIDDIFFVWLRGEQRLKSFIDKLNSIERNLKLTWHTNQESISFLDVTVFNDNGLLKVKTFQKSMNLYLYIPWDSFHSIKTKEGFIKGELIRYVKTNSDEEDFNAIRNMFALRLQSRGYPPWFIRKCFNQVPYLDRHKYLYPSERLTTDVKPIFFKLPYHEVFIEQRFAQSVRKHWYLLGKGQDTLRPVIAFERNPNLSTLLTTSSFQDNIEEDSESDGDLSLLLDYSSDEQAESKPHRSETRSDIRSDSINEHDH